MGPQGGPMPQVQPRSAAARAAATRLATMRDWGSAICSTMEK